MIASLVTGSARLIMRIKVALRFAKAIRVDAAYFLMSTAARPSGMLIA